MTTLYKTITSERTAEGATLDFYTLFDLFSNDWSTLGGVQDLILLEDTVASATSPSWVPMQTFYFEMPTYSLDARFDDLEVVLALRVQAYADVSPACDIRIVNSDASLTGTSVSVTETSYTVQPLMSIVFPLASIPTGRTTMKIQGRWNSDPSGSETLFVQRIQAASLGDCEIFVRKVV